MLEDSTIPTKTRGRGSSHVRAMFELTREDLEKIKKRVLSKWDVVEEESETTVSSSSKPHALSTFVLTCAHVLVCIAKAIHGLEREKHKFAFAFTVDCRARLEPPIPDNYCGNCVWSHLVDTESLDFIMEEGVIIVAKSIHSKVKMLGDKGVFQMSSRYKALKEEGFEIMGIAGSNRFGVYGTDFGWGKPAKVEITSVDKGLNIGFA